MALTEFKKYVEESWNIGMRRVNKIIDDEKANGYAAWATGTYSNLPDILVFDYDPAITSGEPFDPMVRVYEVTNYARPDEYIRLDRATRYRDTLLQFRSEKIFVCSYEENLNQLTGGRDFFEQHGIEVRIVGYQD